MIYIYGSYLFYFIFIFLFFPVYLSVIGWSCHKYHSCRYKHVLVATKHVFCHDKSMLVASILLSRQKRYLWQIPPMIHLRSLFLWQCVWSFECWLTPLFVDSAHAHWAFEVCFRFTPFLSAVSMRRFLFGAPLNDTLPAEEVKTVGSIQYISLC